MSRVVEDWVEAPVRDRATSSIQIVADQARAAIRAWFVQDEAEAREALRALSAEADLLAKCHPLPLPDRLARRQRVAAEREPTGRSGSS
jgi:hypothetical protein